MEVPSPRCSRLVDGDPESGSEPCSGLASESTRLSTFLRALRAHLGMDTSLRDNLEKITSFNYLLISFRCLSTCAHFADACLQLLALEECNENGLENFVALKFKIKTLVHKKLTKIQKIRYRNLKKLKIEENRYDTFQFKN